MPYEQVSGLRLYYETAGSGPPLVMIMGLAGHAGWWDPEIITELSRDFRLLVFDNRDSGRSSLALGPYSIRTMVDDTMALMHLAGMERANVLGFSMGGMIAQELVIARPDRVEKLILASTTPGTTFGVPPTPAIQAGLEMDRGALTPEQAVDLFIRVLYSPGWVAADKARLDEARVRLGSYLVKEEGYRRQLLAISGFDPARRLREVEVPTLVLHGTADLLVPVENAAKLGELIPGAKVELFEGAGHAVWGEQPRKFVEVVKAFLVG